jgi:hypothetical protein
LLTAQIHVFRLTNWADPSSSGSIAGLGLIGVAITCCALLTQSAQAGGISLYEIATPAAMDWCKAAAVFAAYEFRMIRAEKTGQFGAAVRWIHVPVWGIFLSLVGFVRVCLRGGRNSRTVSVLAGAGCPSFFFMRE